MKLGNISQTIVPIPNFFIDQKSRQIEAFNLYDKIDSQNYNKYNNNKKPISLKKNIKSQLDIDETSSNSSKSIPKTLFKHNNSNFKAHDVLTTFFDLNINNNPRIFTRQYSQLNKEKYIPIYYTKNYPNMTQIKETYFP